MASLPAPHPDPDIQALRLDGIPTFVASTGAMPLRACLMFRVGTADESLSRHGVTHLVEHLALEPLGEQPYKYNGMVDGLFTRFYAAGSRRASLIYRATDCWPNPRSCELRPPASPPTGCGRSSTTDTARPAGVSRHSMNLGSATQIRTRCRAGRGPGTRLRTPSCGLMAPCPPACVLGSRRGHGLSASHRLPLRFACRHGPLKQRPASGCR
jgi:hypothetical protein